MMLSLESREPAYQGNGVWYWRCASQDGDLPAVLADFKHLLPWDVFRGMPGSRGYVAEYESRDAAMAAFAAGKAKKTDRGSEA